METKGSGVVHGTELVGAAGALTDVDGGGVYVLGPAGTGMPGGSHPPL